MLSFKEAALQRSSHPLGPQIGVKPRQGGRGMKFTLPPRAPPKPTGILRLWTWHTAAARLTVGDVTLFSTVAGREVLRVLSPELPPMASGSGPPIVRECLVQGSKITIDFNVYSAAAVEVLQAAFCGPSVTLAAGNSPDAPAPIHFNVEWRGIMMDYDFDIIGLRPWMDPAGVLASLIADQEDCTTTFEVVRRNETGTVDGIPDVRVLPVTFRTEFFESIPPHFEVVNAETNQIVQLTIVPPTRTLAPEALADAVARASAFRAARPPPPAGGRPGRPKEAKRRRGGSRQRQPDPAHDQAHGKGTGQGKQQAPHDGAATAAVQTAREPAKELQAGRQAAPAAPAAAKGHGARKADHLAESAAIAAGALHAAALREAKEAEAQRLAEQEEINQKAAEEAKAAQQKAAKLAAAEKKKAEKAAAAKTKEVAAVAAAAKEAEDDALIAEAIAMEEEKRAAAAVATADGLQAAEAAPAAAAADPPAPPAGAEDVAALAPTEANPSHEESNGQAAAEGSEDAATQPTPLAEDTLSSDPEAPTAADGSPPASPPPSLPDGRSSQASPKGTRARERHDPDADAGSAAEDLADRKRVRVARAAVDHDMTPSTDDYSTGESADEEMVDAGGTDASSASSEPSA